VHQGEAKDFSADQRLAAVMLQAAFRGYKARQEVKRVYGFEARTLGGKSKVMMNNQSAKEIEQARELVQSIRKNLPPFDYSVKPDGYPGDKKRIKKDAQKLENGAEYQGEWDE